MTMELAAIIAQLENYTGKFPRVALEEAISQRDAIVPILLETLEKWKDNLEDLLELPDYQLHIYALYLLAQFREQRAYPLIVEFFSAPGEISADVTGDLVTESLGQIIASVCDGNIEPIKSLIENRQIDEYVRCAALKSLIVLLANGVISSELLLNYFQELFSSRLEKQPVFIWTELVIYSAELYPQQLKSHIEQANESNLIETFFINIENLNDDNQLNFDTAIDRLRNDSRSSFIIDTIAEMEHWACFQEQSPTKTTHQPQGIEQFLFVTPQPKKSQKSKKKAKQRMQKQSRRQNRKSKK